MTRHWDLVVIGAGPAGLSAALEAACLGVDVLLLDEYGQSGGQYMKQPTAPPETAAGVSPQVREGRALIAAVEAAGVETWHGSTVLGVFPGFRLCLERDGRGIEVFAIRLIIASGAHERTMAFPGWTLPGVMTPGCAQTLAKSQHVLPGRRIVLAGSGPFLLVVAKQLLDAGAEIVAYVETARWSWSWLFTMAGFPERWGELAGLAATVLTRRVPLRLGSAVVAAHGQECLKRITIARLDRAGRPLPDSKIEIEADTLAVANGFRPSTELTALLGCRHGFDDRRGGRFCVVDESSGATSLEGVYAVGEVTGIGGSRVACAEGCIAGLSAAKSLGRWDGDADRRLSGARHRRRRAQRFADFVNRAFEAPKDLSAILSDDAIVCRCEEVTAGEIGDAVRAGARTVAAVKMWTRCGMGRCQGRICGWTANRYITALTGLDTAEVGVNEPRFPIKPVALARLLEGAGTQSARPA
jgi:NADPH-dependent 2,4-dienoyl-CoA reductase/sulfur reductase-like enzyme